MSDRSISNDARDLGAFIPSFLDDYGLDPFEFRVYAHIARRAGGGVCFEGLNGIARCCRMDIKTVRSKIAVLVDIGMIRCKEFVGRPYEFTLTKHSEWAHPETIEETRKKHTPTKNGRGTKTGSTRSGRGTKSGGGTPTNTGTPPLPDLVPKGDPIKGTPSKEESGAVAPHAPASGEKPKQGSSKRSRETAEQVYASLADRSGFDAFWVWYKKQICTIAGSNEGDKSKAAVAWRDLEQDNFRGVGREGFRLACKIYKDKAIASKGIGVPHAERFLSGGELKEPRWLVLYLEHNVEGDSSFLEGVCNEDDLQDLKKAIAAELSRLGWRGVIPDEWRKQSGCDAQVVSDLDAKQAKAYLQYLRGQNVPVAS